MSEGVAVIIAAKDAEHRIGRAISSALQQRQVVQVIVVDDGSADGTSEAALSAAGESGRVEVVRFETNRGPAAARNAALRVCRAPLVAILDSDDFFLPGRLDVMLATSGWDLVADNILFVPEAQLGSLDLTNLRGFGDDRFSLELADFVLGNISKRGAPRGELGFLKPVIRREFFERHQLAYREEMRLGEDFELYARMLALGARFTVTRACGYVAVERADSLSARHSVRDLARMADAEQELLKTIPISTAAADALRRHHAQLARKVRHGTFLARKREAGVIAAAWGARSEPRTLFEVAYSVAGDKLAGARQRWVETENAEARARFLLPPG